MASMPPNKFSGGPPPGSMPQRMSAMNMTPMQRAPQGNPEAQGGGAGLAKMFFAIEQSIDALASAIPEQAEQLDKIKSSLREILASAVSGGAAFIGGEKEPGGPISGPSEPMI